MTRPHATRGGCDAALWALGRHGIMSVAWVCGGGLQEVTGSTFAVATEVRVDAQLWSER